MLLAGAAGLGASQGARIASRGVTTYSLVIIGGHPEGGIDSRRDGE
jgi:hypothetical protein